MSVIQVTPVDALGLLKDDENSVLIDVRTPEEFIFVGNVDATKFNNRMILLPWQLLPNMDENPEFSNSLSDSIKEILGNDSKDNKLVFMCKVGGRSGQAAQYALNLGYKNCYNITNGFEGDLNDKGHRGEINGWKASKLDWRQR